MNKVTLAGRLTNDPIIRTIGESICANFTIAVNRKFKKDGEQTADFINCKAWSNKGNGPATFIEKYFHKGDGIVVSGRIETGSYQKDGKNVYTTDIVIEEVEFPVGGKKSEGSADKEERGFVDAAAAIDEELPFR